MTLRSDLTSAMDMADQSTIGISGVQQPLGVDDYAESMKLMAALGIHSPTGQPTPEQVESIVSAMNPISRQRFEASFAKEFK